MVATVVIGTAGHIDHGKTALLHALSGIDADRLPEERTRGMTIDVGYAHLAFDDGVELDFVDVPGHDRLIGNMLVGAGEIDAALLVVAADDGPRPQTLEHLALLDALGIRDGLAVVTKIDLVDRERTDAVVAEVRDILQPTWLAGAPVLAVSAVGGTGVAALQQALRAVRDNVVQRWNDPAWPRGDGHSRLAVDRAFTAKGRGLVVTGSLRGAALHAGQSLRVEPSGHVARVRELQVHGVPKDGHDGGRTALNLAGPTSEFHRGDVLTDDPRVRGTDRLLVQPAPAAPSATLEWPRRWPPKGGSSFRLHVGTDQVDGRVRRVTGIGRQVLLDLDRPTATFPGERAILREPGAGVVVGGIVVLDPRPPRGVSRRRMTAGRLEGLASAVDRGDAVAIDAARLDLHGVLAADSADEAQANRSIAFAPDVATALATAAVDAVATHHRGAPLSAGMPLPRARAALLRTLRSLATVERRDADAAAAAISKLLDDLVADGRLARDGGALRDPARTEARPAGLVHAMDRLEAALAVAAPPPLPDAATSTGCPPEGVRALQADGRIVRIGTDLAWAAPTYRRLAGLALDMARAAPLTPAAFRDATDTSRRYVLAILEDLDRREILRRTPEGHIPGPRAPRPRAVASEVAT